MNNGFYQSCTVICEMQLFWGLNMMSKGISVFKTNSKVLCNYFLIGMNISLKLSKFDCTIVVKKIVYSTIVCIPEVYHIEVVYCISILETFPLPFSRWTFNFDKVNYDDHEMSG